jgi:4-carboxymuconolactone decarboxylase
VSYAPSTVSPKEAAMADTVPKIHGPYADVAPTLDRITQQLLFGEVWERPELSKRDRSLVTVATLVAQYRI